MLFSLYPAQRSGMIFKRVHGELLISHSIRRLAIATFTDDLPLILAVNIGLGSVAAGGIHGPIIHCRELSCQHRSAPFSLDMRHLQYFLSVNSAFDY
jgi:hypothetical protein